MSGLDSDTHTLAQLNQQFWLLYLQMDPEDLAAVQEQEARLKGISGAQGGGTGTAAGAGGQQQRLASSKSK